MMLNKSYKQTRILPIYQTDLPKHVSAKAYGVMGPGASQR